MKNNNILFTNDAQRWEAIQNRDNQADGMFVYGVKTTDIYCRPSCASRQPNHENVRFFNTAKLAETAGYRPCKRCKPQSDVTENEWESVALKVCRMIDEADGSIQLDQMANELGYSQSHLIRIFKNVMGITPKQYAIEKRNAKVRTKVREADSITQAVYDAGFRSSSRFYEKATNTLGMRPGQYRKGGVGVTVGYSIVETYLKWTLIGITEKGVCWIGFDDDREILRSKFIQSFPNARIEENDAQFTQTIEEMIAYIESPMKACDLPLDIHGTVFQRRVWEALRMVQPGEKVTYKDIAEQIGQPKAYRAVANACAANKLAVAIPCHRVIRGDGGLGGYRWGLKRKRALLEKESKPN